MSTDKIDPLGLYRNEANQMKQSPFHLIAKPAGPLCNLDCHYCFYLEKTKLFSGSKSDMKMSDATLKLFVRQYIQRQPQGAQEVNFVWQGGEPTLMGLDFFRRAVRYQKQYARKGMKVSNSFQTNGILIDDDWCRFFYDHEFLVGISIDGPEAMQDKYRCFKDGRGSFSYVMKAVELFHKHKVEFNTLTVVQADNGEHPLEVYRFLKSIGSKYLQFIPIVEPETGQEDLRGECPSDKVRRASYRSVGSLQWGHFMTSIFNEWVNLDIGETFVQLFDNVLAMIHGYPASVCVFRPTCGRAMVIEHNGDIFSCDHFVFEENRLGNLHKKDLGLMVNSDQQMLFGVNKRKELPEKCRKCPWYQLCFCECPANRIIKADDGKMINHLCEGYTYFYENTTRYFEAMSMALKNDKLALNYRDYL